MAELTREQQVNVAALRRLIEEGFSGGATGVVDEVCAQDLVEHQEGFDPPSREGVKRGISFLHALSPDIEVTMAEVDAVADRVWAWVRARGTHSGAILGGPTGRPFEITVMDVCRFRDGKIVEHWGVADRFAQMMQLGLLQLGPQAAAQPSGSR